MSPAMWYGDLMVIAGRYITKGDANWVVDNFSNPNLQIVGIHRFHVPGLGYPLLFLFRLLGRA